MLPFVTVADNFCLWYLVNIMQEIKENRQVTIDTRMPINHRRFVYRHMLQVQMSSWNWQSETFLFWHAVNMSSMIFSSTYDSQFLWVVLHLQDNEYLIDAREKAQNSPGFYLLNTHQINWNKVGKTVK